MRVIDFHNHFVGPSFTLTTMNIAPPALQASQARVNALLSDPRALLGSLDVAGVAARVINMPTAFLQDADGNVPKGTIPRINDEVATLAAKNPGKLYGLATVDAYSGDDGARELTRAVRELELRGVFIESAKGDLLPNAPQARPTLTAAAELGIPVFVHPITDPHDAQALPARPAARACGSRARPSIRWRSCPCSKAASTTHCRS